MKNIFFIIYLFTFSNFLYSCAHKKSTLDTSPSIENINQPDSNEVSINDQIAGLINKSRTEKFSNTLPVDVLFATNREFYKKGPPCSNQSFGLNYSEEMQYGICRINVPRNHATGKIEFSTDYTSDTNKYFKLLSHKKIDFDAFQKALSINSNKEVLIFIHGFNVKFQEAVLRASQIAYDLKFQGKVVLFSWPSGAEDGMLNSAMISKTYLANKLNASKTIKAAIDFFDLISRLNLRINIYVHSMGHQVVIPALTELAKNSDVKMLANELILNAPDFDLKEFIVLAPSLLKLANRITLYCSNNDTAILASETLNGGTRLGACEVVPGMDVINVSEIDNPALGLGLGHSYYSSRAVLTDVAQLLMGLEAENRLFIRRSESNSKENFYLRP